ncbi:hypothetical protein EDD16DRAFT_920523 [Pisolithus croceorrhizus]|nr:hypothetical protein EDD16DRAFT_920523 [Pisolithus croceorrhizus]KAI6134623.1 hypothetical protein EV401DRAFT_1903724 [Pisolithus croceorrhizus]KAI6166080.1 hypothetical protein EDD17DRAFT_121185 [Pisolithus thermaeus]
MALADAQALAGRKLLLFSTNESTPGSPLPKFHSSTALLANLHLRTTRNAASKTILSLNRPKYTAKISRFQQKIVPL